MKPYNKLTKLGKKLRLRKVVELALKHYELSIKEFHFYDIATNVLFKLHGEDGVMYLMKIFSEESSSYEDNLCEVFMIDQVKENSNLIVPEVIHTAEGKGVIRVDSKYTETAKRVIVYKWIDGVELDANETMERFKKLGEITAQLHDATMKVKVPEEVTPKKFDKVYYFKDEKAVYKEQQYQKFISKEYHEVMDFMVPYVDEKLSALFQKPGMQLIHGDINPWNVLCNGDDVQVIDFEDASYGYPVQDIAIMLFYYRYDENFDFDEVRKTYLEGYSKVRDLPEFTDFDLEIIMIARRLNFMNYILLISEDPKEYIKTNVKRVQDFMRTHNIMIPVT